jgi:hypothetical protein
MREASLFAFPPWSILADSIKDDHTLAFRLTPKFNSLLGAFRLLEEDRKDFRANQITQVSIRPVARHGRRRWAILSRRGYDVAA